MFSHSAWAVTMFCCAAHNPHEGVKVRVGRGDKRTLEFVKIHPQCLWTETSS